MCFFQLNYLSVISFLKIKRKHSYVSGWGRRLYLKQYFNAKCVAICFNGTLIPFF